VNLLVKHFLHSLAILFLVGDTVMQCHNVTAFLIGHCYRRYTLLPLLT